MTSSFIPKSFQRPLPHDQLVLHQKPSEDALPMDVVFVGAGPAGLAGAIELAQLAKKDGTEIEIGVFEKSQELGQHCLSGAIVNPMAFRELFPDLTDQDFPFRKKVNSERIYILTESESLRLPIPPTMRNEGNYVASICEMVRWLGAKAEELGVNIFKGFPADALLAEGDRVRGLRTTPSGLLENGAPGPSFTPPTDVTARVTVLTEGTRGPLTQAYTHWQKIHSPNPQIFALGVKELWEVKHSLPDVIHTLGWPLPNSAFGGSFFYPLDKKLAAIGIVVGLDYSESSLEVHGLLQKLKRHPFFRHYLEDGDMLEWGAKTIPEGGFYSLPERFHGDGLLMAGDTVGFVDVPSLKGIHYAMLSGIYAARTAYQALKKNDTSRESLASYDDTVRNSVIHRDMYRTRNMRLGFKSGFFAGGLKAGLMTLTGGFAFGTKIEVKEDAQEPKEVSPPEKLEADGKLTFTKLDGVFRSGNNTREDMPPHLTSAESIPADVQQFYVDMCPAAVYERRGEELGINSSNCVDCKTTDILGPRWRPREGGAGTKYKRM